jgi:hypothetical protein
MPVYTVHEPVRRTDDAIAHTARFVFVRDGFHFWAFLLTPLWMLRHRMVLEFIAWVLILAGAFYALRRFGIGGSAAFWVYFLISLLIGIEASTLRRWKLARRKFANLGVVVADDLEAAERRFFDGWVADAEPRVVTRAPPPPPAMPPRSPFGPVPSNDIVGLFPQPGTRP